ncbi:MAG: acetate kinase, partial [Christensenellaceae bacterium]|nr:acetate kinase [Christensenellaceae bacterium]
MKILVINAGSSSLKYQLIDMKDESVIAKGIAERIGIDGSNLTHKYGDGGKYQVATPMTDHTEALKYVLDALLDKAHGVISSIDEIGAVGHRVLHGGEKITKSTLIDDYVLSVIEEYIPLGPLHNPANLMGIRGCMSVMPNTPMVAVFDTAFHQTMPRQAFLYALPQHYYREMGVRRNGFHGTSHRYVAGEIVKKLNRPNTKVVICHLGNGS